MQISNLHVILKEKCLRKCTRPVRGDGLNFSHCYTVTPSAGVKILFYPPPASYFGDFSEKSRPHGSSLHSSQDFEGGGTDGHVDYDLLPRLPSVPVGSVFGVFDRTPCIHGSSALPRYKTREKRRFEHDTDLFREVV